jgi:hypothetical protein
VRSVRNALLALLLASTLQGAVALDTSANSSQAPASGTDVAITIAYTVTGSNTYLIVGVSVYDSVRSSGIMSAVTYNGVAMARINQTFVATTRTVDMWGLKNPATGTHNVVLTNGGAQSQATSTVIISSWTGVDQTTPIGTSAVATGTTTASTTVTSVAGGAAVDQIAESNSQTPTVTGSGQTQLQYGTMGTFISGGGSYILGAGATLSWTTSGGLSWASVAVPLNPVASSRRVRVTAENLLRPIANLLGIE